MPDTDQSFPARTDEVDSEGEPRSTISIMDPMLALAFAFVFAVLTACALAFAFVLNIV